jgi:dCTP deaminase
MVMPYQDIKQHLTGRLPIVQAFDARLPLIEQQIQPASYDFRLGYTVFGVRSAALPHGKRVEELVKDPRHCWCEFELGLDKMNPLRAHDTYLVRLAETLALPPDVYAEFSPKSSTGRCDVFVRVLCDNFSSYDETPPGYHGPLWLEITSLSHEIGIRAGLSLVQARFKTVGERRLSTGEISAYQAAEGIAFNFGGEPIPTNRLEVKNGELALHVDLDREVQGFVARDTTTGTLDLTKRDALEPYAFWEPIRNTGDKELVIMPGKFYLLVTEERIRIPPSVCGHVLPSVVTMGELRLHYAGFFDNGFGGEHGAHGVLEVRGRDVPFKIEHGRPVGAMLFERTSSVPTKLYGQDGNNYKDHLPSLSKHFKSRQEAWTGAYWRGIG